MSKEKQLWMATSDSIDPAQTYQLGPYSSVYAKTDPKHLVFTLSRYKFIAKMLRQNSRVLELGCSDGFGTTLFKEAADSIVGIDFDERAINWAREYLQDSQLSFQQGDIFALEQGKFDAVVSLDVIEHIYPENEWRFIDSILRHLEATGMAIIGTPNITAEQYASKNEQHVNLYTGERLKSTFEDYFHNVFLFGMNDEVLHTGYTPMCHYLFVVCCNPKASQVSA